MIKKTFLDGRYSPSTGLEMSEWQIILVAYKAGGCKYRQRVI
jgi:hypothetical protein